MRQRRYLSSRSAAILALGAVTTTPLAGCGGDGDSRGNETAGRGGGAGVDASAGSGNSPHTASGGGTGGHPEATGSGGNASIAASGSAGGAPHAGGSSSSAGGTSRGGEPADGGENAAGALDQGGTSAAGGGTDNAGSENVAEGGGAPENGGAAGSGGVGESGGVGILGDLGFDTDVDPLTNPDGDELTDADNPLGGRVTNLAKADEAFIISKVGFTALFDWGYSADASAYTFNDITDSVTDTSTDPLSAADGLFKYPIAADMDGDGKQEVVIVAASPAAQKLSFYRLTQSGAAADSEMGITLAASLDWTVPEAPAHVRNGLYALDFAAGDLDGDGRDELVMAEMAGCDHDSEDCFTELAEHPTLAVFDDDFSYDEALSQPFERMGSGYDTLRVEAKDLNHDRKAEVIVTHGNTVLNTVATVSIYETAVDHATATPKVAALNRILSPRSLLSTASTPVSIRTAEVKVGDVDGDGQNELVFAGLSSDQVGHIETLVMRYTLSHGALSDASLLPVSGDGVLVSEQATWVYTLTDGVWQNFRDGDNMAPILALGDMDGNGADEIVSGDDVWALTAAEAGSATLDYAFKQGDDPSPNSRGILREGLVNWDTQAVRDAWWTPFPRDTAYFDNVQVGDLDGDGRDEIVVMDYEPSLDTVRLRHFAWNATTAQIERSPTTDAAMSEAVGLDDGALLCLADVDRDSTVVEYVGHTLTFSEPIIIAALASAPYYANLNQDVDSCSTVYGRTTDVSAGVSASVGFSLGRSIGATAEVPILANGEISATTTTTYSWEFSASVGRSYSIEVDYENPGGQNGVLFTAVPIDVYFYRVISADSTRDDQPQVGDILDVQSMRPVRRTKFASAEYYNSHNGDHPDIDERVFSFEIGAPRSYPTYDEAAAQIASNLDAGQALLLSSAEGTLPVGGGVATVTVANSTALGGSFSFEAEYSREVEVSFIVSAGESQSASVGFSIDVEYATGTVISGSVGGISEDDYSSEVEYTWGIYSYPQWLEGMPFTVVNYWVE